MADYINKNILSQAYIHVEPTTVDIDSSNEFRNFKKHIESFVSSRTSFYLGDDVSIQIDFEEGSLIARITVIGTLVATGICNYPDFREGLKYLYQDSKRLAEYIVSEVQFNTGAKNQNVIRLEARTGVVGALNKISIQIENIKNSSQYGQDVYELTRKLDKVQEDLADLIVNLNNEEDIKVVKNGLFSTANNIPLRPKEPKDKINSLEGILLYQRRREHLIKTLKVN